MEKILEVKNLKKEFPIKGDFFFSKKSTVKAVDTVSFELYKGETLGLVGESGSGKSTVGRTVLKLLDPTGGEIFYRGQNISFLRGEELRKLRKNMQMIFQDPYASLNPRMTIGECIMEPMLAHALCTRSEAEAKAYTLLEQVGLDKEYFFRFPHQFSGGQRQRIGIARALGLNPEIIIADEPVSALDVSIQAQIINLFKDLQIEYDFTYVLIAHDLSVVMYLSDRIAVMYLGEIVELCDSKELINQPMHPYTQALISAIPIPDPTKQGKRIILEGDIPSPSNVPKGCRFSTRCVKCFDRCREVHPELRIINGHSIRCHLYDEVEVD